MRRAFYSVPVGKLAAGEQVPDAVEVRRNSTSAYLLSAVDPNPYLEALGATRLGWRLRELTSTQRSNYLVTQVERVTDEGETETLLVRSADVEVDDTIVAADVMAVMFAGDEPVDYDRDDVVAAEPIRTR